MSEPRLPRAVQAEVERAEQIEREIQAAIEATNPPDATMVVEEPPVMNIDAPPPDPDYAPDAPAAAPEPPVEARQDDPDSPTWQARYQALQGKYNAEVPRYAQQLREALQRIQDLETRMSAPPEAAKPAEAALDQRYAEAVELFGEDLVNFTREMAQAEADRRVADVMKSLQQVDQKVAQSEHERFFAQVDAAVPGWREIDTNPEWLGWLQEYDPLLGAPRQAALEQAAAAHDVRRVAHLFKTFMGSQAPAASVAPTRRQLEQVTPRPTGYATAAPVQPSRVYTQKDIQRLLDPRYLKTLPREQQAAIERDIDMAVAEGRIAA